MAVQALSLVAASGGFSLRWLLSLWSAGSRARRLSSCGSRAVGRAGSAAAVPALERRLSSCGARAQLLHCMWALPASGIEPVSPASTGGFFTTEPPGKLSSSFK